MTTAFILNIIASIWLISMTGQVAARNGAVGGLVVGVLISLYYLRVARRFAEQHGDGSKSGGFTQMTSTTVTQ